ncbi:maleylpyruvate isomerase N-terminal domain-containing protein [Couchioplanes caeruleus]|uniref:maleylpyruvate isomerase N-terminal domain-containing protein n=1 Tax=Couchioplanes caeruleus TaxID=56438 RepID=UPI00201CA034|nr:maleylpyruvate isomerase N-terminal domain-containing protein [Couchioplanes caeruleus]UQU61929.1 maleylpyruvate isomerase N-terminal domain-containing protein [Couchioplanes caeruleus]
MTPITGRHVERAVQDMRRVLTPYAAADWDVPAGSLTWTCWTTAAHVAHDLTAYAMQLSAREPRRYLPLDLRVRPGTPPDEILEVIGAAGRLLATAVSAAPPDARAWHWGPTDASGFAALGVTETLVHTYDVSQGLGIPWLPPDDLAAEVLQRLFPDAPPGDPVRALLWCTGRVALPDRPRRTSWVLAAAIDD